MPLGMGGYVQSVVVQGRVYVGGGYAGSDSDDNYILMEYDISAGKWDKLPPYLARGFAMTVINNQLVLVGGGLDHGCRCRMVLGKWKAESKEWTHSYLDIPTARRQCSEVVYNEWLVVVGGYQDVRSSSVEVMNTDSEVWYAAPPTPTPWSSMKTAIVGDTCYFMGGHTDASDGPTTEVYSVSLPALISQLHSPGTRKRGKQQQIWKKIPGLQTTRSTPLAINGSLLAIGGRADKAVTAIYLYQLDTGNWVKVGDLPTPRYCCTCAMITDQEILVAGGEDDKDELSRSDVALINNL